VRWTYSPFSAPCAAAFAARAASRALFPWLAMATAAALNISRVRNVSFRRKRAAGNQVLRCRSSRCCSRAHSRSFSLGRLWLRPLRFTFRHGRNMSLRRKLAAQRAVRSSRCCSRCQSRSFSVARLSCCFLPLARPISSFTRPRA